MDQVGLKPHLPRVVALVGTPNSGKTSLFNALSGLNQRVGNFPGVTVERKSANISLNDKHSIRLIDLPGTDSLYPSAEDEFITSDILKNVNHEDHPDTVLVIADATQLNRGLMLCTQVMDLGFSTMLVLNMMDVIERDKHSLDLDKLTALLGIPVIGISAVKKHGLNQLKKRLSHEINKPVRPFMNIPGGFRPAIDLIKKELPGATDYRAYQALIHPESFPSAISENLTHAQNLAELDEETSQRLISNELLVRLDKAGEIISQVLKKPLSEESSLTERLDYVFTHKIWGYVIFIALLMLIFQAIFSWATYPMDAIDMAIEQVKGWTAAVLPAYWLTDLLIEGVITGFGGIIIFIPQIAFLFFFIAIMEESGYMARVVYLMDRIMRPFGFSGKSVIPLMGGMACAIPSIMMSRNIPNKTERLITILVTPLMSCSARIPVYTLLIAMFIPAATILGFDQRGLYMSALYFLGFFLALLMAFVFKKVLKYQANQVFVMEMPSYRMPLWRNVGLTVWQKTLAFVFGAGKIILAITIILWFLVAFGPGNSFEQIDQKYDQQLQISTVDTAEVEILRANEKLEASYAARLGKFIEPVIRPLGYDWKIGISLITSFAAREVFVGTMSIIYQQEDPEGLEEEEQETGRLRLIERMKAEISPATGKPIYTPAVVWSLIVFYAISMQCMSTLAVARKEIGVFWAGVMLVYLTLLAYVGAMITFQVLS